MDTIKRYLQQPSTWRGLALILSASGIVIAPAAAEAIGLGIITLIGLIETVRDSAKGK